MRVLLTDEDITAGSTSSYTGPVPKFGDQQGGVIQLSDPDDKTTKVGDYSFLITFLDDAIGCVATGAYTFPNGDQVTFAASCSGLVGPPRRLFHHGRQGQVFRSGRIRGLYDRRDRLGTESSIRIHPRHPRLQPPAPV